MINSTLCYIEKDGKYLMLCRNRKKNDCNFGKWIGVGGKLEEGEGPENCLLREVREETGLLLTDYRIRGIVTFVSDKWETEQMYLLRRSVLKENCADVMRGRLNGFQNQRYPSFLFGRETEFF